MSRQGQNRFNNTKSNTTPVISRDPTTAILEQTNTDEAEENVLKMTSGKYLRLLKRK